jgi:beta-lysine 5,6-aminomutase alpha subunit
VNDALRLNGDLVDRARAAANEIADDIQQHIEEHTTDTTERATLRLLGIVGVNEIDVPLVNVVAEHARDLLPGGIIRPFVDLMNQTGRSAQEVAEGVTAGDLTLAGVPADRRASRPAPPRAPGHLRRRPRRLPERSCPSGSSDPRRDA